MSKPFLKAEWRNLLMANFEIDPGILRKYIPCHTELDEFNGICYVSLVGFLFKDTRIRGMSFPFHRNFEEVNLRFYIRYKEGSQWKRGVVFMKEIVPRRMITFVANTIYGEKYATHQMKHTWQKDQEDFKVEYNWKVGREWNYLRAIAESTAQPIDTGSEEEFITEHYWGYMRINDTCTGQYEVTHPRWKVHAVKSFEMKCSTEQLYGRDFVSTLNQSPISVFLAEGSEIKVMGRTKIYG
jgi:hypothetical protein